MKNIFRFIKLLFILFSCFVSGQTKNEEMSSDAMSSYKEIEQKDSFVDNISKDNLVSLPIGLKSRIAGDNTTYTIGVTKAKFYPAHTEIQVFAKIDIPQKGKDGLPMSLFFGADNIKLSHDGGIIGDAKLALLGDINIPIDNKWMIRLFGGFNKQTGETEDLTYVVIDCDGFKEMKLSGAVEFSRELILPILDGKVEENERDIPIVLGNGSTVNGKNRVRGYFNSTVSGWNDILIEVSLDPFVLAKKQNGSNYDGNFQFLVNKGLLDLSDVRNSGTIKFPKVYTDKGLLFPAEDNWKGVYVETLEVALPSEFKTEETINNNKRIHIGASELIIDKFGVSGTFYAENVFSIGEGLTDKENAWAYSLDNISIKVETNRLLKANFSGEIILPVTKIKENSTDQTKYGFNYDGIISESEYGLTVSTNNHINFDIWKAKAILNDNSSIQFKVKDGKFMPKANLNGVIDFSVAKSSKDEDNKELADNEKTVDFKGLTFENLILQTESPMIQIGNIGYKDNIKLGNFPVSIGGIEVLAQNNRADLYFDLDLNLMDKSEFKAKARLGINGEMQVEGKRMRWKYSGLDLSAITIDASFSGLKMAGRLDLLENDPKYGNGFNADLKVVMTGAFEVGAKAIFGYKDFRYWYFDGSAKLTGASYFINGFGGGAYYKMKRNAIADPSEFSPTGLTYEPDENTGLGLKAMVSFAIGSDKAFNGEAVFELQFNKHGGLDCAAIYGKGQVLAEIPGLDNIGSLVSKVNGSLESKATFLNMSNNSDNRSSFENRFLPLADTATPDDTDGKATIKFKTAIQFDIVNKSTHGTLDVFINAGFISGVGANGRAGWAVFHKDPSDWYLHIGTPDNRIGIKLGVAGVSLKTTSYLMAGTKLPGSPPPPSHVADMLGVDVKELNYMRDENALANAGGFAFGSDLSIDTGDLTFLIFYANFKAGVGFDLMLKNYEKAECVNTGDKVGIDGWYANGQAYAYLQGELGVRVKLSFVRMKVPIITAGAAVLMQAKLPNPVWLRGYVSGNMDIMGGLIKGKFNFKVTIGEQCDFAGGGGAIDGMKMIMDVTPKSDSSDIDVFVSPQATFAMKVNEPIEIPEGDVKNTYKVVLEKFHIVDENNKVIDGKLEWSMTKDRVTFNTTEILPPNKQLKVQVEVSFQKMENGIFRSIVENGQPVKEFEERIFSTGSAPNYIPLKNIEYSYPVVDQKYFFSDEYKEGYVKLKKGQDYLFEDNNWETGVRILDSKTNKEHIIEFNYDNAKNELFYQMPELNTSSEYKLTVYSNIKNTSESNVASNDKIFTEDGNDFKIDNKNAENIVREGELERLAYSFKTSEHETFVDKIKAIKVSQHGFDIHLPDVISLINIIRHSEPFEEADLTGNKYTDNIPLISVEAVLDDNYFIQNINPVLYSKIPVGNTYTIKNRDINLYGLVPSRALSINNRYLTNVRYNVNYEELSTYFPYEYDLALIYKNDMGDIKNQIANDLSSNIIDTNHPAYTFLNNNYIFIKKGVYKVKMTYKIPGGKNISQEYQIYKNVIK